MKLLRISEVECTAGLIYYGSQDKVLCWVSEKVLCWVSYGILLEGEGLVIFYIYILLHE
ncbi:hypothetical protein BDZ91DRAFT_713833 [Kalaharituber pfeilii]|nr:hypothetical protein BDZ91DRAFT_713833 [Kalaharituber pfeilii]